MSEGKLIARKGRFGVKLVQDSDPINPCEEYDQAGTLVCWHSRYNLGHTGGDRRQDGEHSKEYAGMFPTPDDFRAWWKKNGKGGLLLPLALLDHSGLHMYVGTGAHQCDPGGWDSGQVGYIFATRETILKEWGKGGRATKQAREQAEKCLRAEVETYDQYLTGDVYGYVLVEYDSEDEDAEVVEDHLDSCWGFFGEKYAKEEATSALKERAKKAATNDEWVKI